MGCCLKLRWRAAASKARRALRGGSRYVMAGSELCSWAAGCMSFAVLQKRNPALSLVKAGRMADLHNQPRGNLCRPRRSRLRIPGFASSSPSLSAHWAAWACGLSRGAAGSASRFQRAPRRRVSALHLYHHRLHDRRHHCRPTGRPIGILPPLAGGTMLMSFGYVLSASAASLPSSRLSPASPSASARRRASRPWWPMPRCGSIGTAASPFR